MAMAAKNQDILETFVVNILELTSDEVPLASVTTVCGDDGETRDLATALSDPQSGGRSHSPQDGAAAVETISQGDEEPTFLVTTLPQTHEAASDSFQIDTHFPAGTLHWETETWPPEEVGPWIGPYHLLETIGEGSFGIVYLAEQVTPVR